MNYRIGDKVWAYSDGIMVRALGWLPAVVVAVPGQNGLLPLTYLVDVIGTPPPHGDIGYPVTHRGLRPRDDGADGSTWSDCAWRPAGVRA